MVFKRALLLLLLAGTLAPTAFAQTYLGDYTGHEVLGRAVTVRAGSSAVRFVFFRPDVVRVDLLPTANTQLDSSLAVVRDTTAAVAIQVASTPDELRITTEAVDIHLSKNPLRLSIRTPEGFALLQEPSSGGLGFGGGERQARFQRLPTDHFYGSGERGQALDLRGHAFDLYNSHSVGYRSPPPTMNLNVAFLANPVGYGIFFDTSYPLRFDLGAARDDVATYLAQGGELSFFVIVAETIPEQIEAYTWLTGRQPLPPKWSLGYIQSKFGYRNETEVRQVAWELRTRGIPCDAIVIDLDWFRQMGDLTWNPGPWPDPAGLVGDLREDGFRTILITEPYVTSRSLNYAEASRRGYFGRRANGTIYTLPDWWSCGCDAALLDLTDPEARRWWWTRHVAALRTGVGGIWTDLGEPERHPWDMVHHLGSTPKVHNVYNLLWAKAIHEGFTALRPRERLFNLTRSGSAGIQRYGAVPWSGDVGRDWEGLAAQVPFLLHAGMSGLGYFNSDIGGYCCGHTTAELYVRWMQFGVFCPITRAHGTGQPTEPWEFGPQAEAICRDFIRLRYRLLPYIYNLAVENHRTGMPIARPLFFADPADASLHDHLDSYLLGDAFLVSPVVAEGRRTQRVRLPAGRWIDFWTDEVREGGGSYTAAAPLERIPVLVRAGSLVPTRTPAEHTGAIATDTLVVWSYPVEDSARTVTLYEDDGETPDYTGGAFAETILGHRVFRERGVRSLELTVGATAGAFEGMPARRIARFEVHGMPQAPAYVQLDGTRLVDSASPPGPAFPPNASHYDSTSEVLTIQFEATAANSHRAVATGIGPPFGSPEQPELPSSSLGQNYPNPFAETTRIPYTLEAEADVLITLGDIRGRRVYRTERQDVPAGDREVILDVADPALARLPSGIYFYTLEAWTVGVENDVLIFRGTRRMNLLR